MSVEFGSVRQIWLAPAHDKASKQAFLIRDDAYVTAEATHGRSVRLGQPIDLGPDGAWRQDGWFGGYDQERWFDEFMYQEGNADTTDRVGRIKLWPNYEQLKGRKNRPEVRIRAMTPGGDSVSTSSPLLAVEDSNYAAGGPSSNYGVYSLKEGAANEFAAQPSTRGLTAIAPLGNETGDAVGVYLVGNTWGNLYRWDQDGGTIALDPTAENPSDTDKKIGWNAIVPYNGATFYGAGRKLRRRAWDGSSVVHTTVKTFGFIDEIRGMVVWQNRIWFMGLSSGGRTYLIVSDGVTAATAIEMPPGFQGHSLVSHYGSLYVGGFTRGGVGSSASVGQLWRYNGSSLTKLWDGLEAQQYGFGIESLASWGRFVAWGRQGSTTLGRRAGVWLYDAEEDAILEGPTIDMNSGASRYAVTSVCSWNNTLAVCFQDITTYTPSTYDYPYMIAFVRRDDGVEFEGNPNDNDGVWGVDSFGYAPSTISQYVLSSAFDADLPGEDKLWTSMFARFKCPVNCQIRLAAIVDGGAEQVIATITHDGNDGWRTGRFDIVDGSGVALKGGEMQYKVYVENTAPATSPLNTPEVDFVSVQYQVAPQRRRLFHVRVLASDGQSLLDGSANPLTTRDAIVSAIQTYWSDNQLLAFWEARADGATPADGDSVTVSLNNFLDQPWRLSSSGSEVMSETSFSLLEVPAAS